jgi:hypothetical protein
MRMCARVVPVARSCLFTFFSGLRRAPPFPSPPHSVAAYLRSLPAPRFPVRPVVSRRRACAYVGVAAVLVAVLVAVLYHFRVAKATGVLPLPKPQTASVYGKVCGLPHSHAVFARACFLWPLLLLLLLLLLLCLLYVYVCACWLCARVCSSSWLRELIAL